MVNLQISFEKIAQRFHLTFAETITSVWMFLMSSESRSSFLIILIATSSPVSLLVALITEPNAPLECHEIIFRLLSNNLMQVVGVFDVPCLVSDHLNFFC